mgnify:CR=1 FL=1
MLRIIFIIIILISNIYANLLQVAINKAPSFSVLKLPKGTYLGNITISKPLTLIGINKGVIIQGEQNSNVITINSSNVKLENLEVINSGKRRDTLDAAILVNNSKNVELKNLIIKKSHIGIFLDYVSDSIIHGNKISSDDPNIDLRGDGVRLWFSQNNKIVNNSFKNVRDIVLMQSNNNTVSNNKMNDCRYSVLTSHSNNTRIENNEIINSSVGIYLQASKGGYVSNNNIKGSLGSATSMGILLKGASNTTVENNYMGMCNQAFYIDNSPMKQGMKNWIYNNQIMYSTRGFDFRGFSLKNVIKGNILLGNMDNIMTESYKGRMNTNEIEGNYWDDYEGFDLNKDNIGDSSYKKYLYIDQIWVKNPEVKFFYGAPILSILNFILKMAPFVEPVFLIEDEKPIFNYEISSEK